MTENKNSLQSMLDPADVALELTEEWFDHADHYRGGVLIRRSRPLGSGSRELRCRCV